MSLNDIKISENFSLREFQCPCCHAVMIHPRLAAAPARIVVRRLGRRTLGQCRRNGEIRLSPALAAWWPEVVEETLAHELTHLTHFNHSPAFWRTLSALLPDWLPRALLHHLG